MGDNNETMMPHHGTTTVSSLTSACNTTGTASMHMHQKVMMHMSFFWGHKADILFSDWPGDNSGMYAVALVVVFALAVLVEWFNHYSIVKTGTNKVAAGFFKTGMYAVRSGFSYMVMLSVMSFNGGVFLAAVGGHAVGFALFGSGLFKKKSGTGGSDLSPGKC